MRGARISLFSVPLLLQCKAVHQGGGGGKSMTHDL